MGYIMTHRGSGPDGAEEYIAAICVGGIDGEVWPSILMTSVLGCVDLAAEQRHQVRQIPKTAPTMPTVAISATMAPMIRPVWEELPILPLLEELLGADPDAELLHTLMRSTAMALVG